MTEDLKYRINEAFGEIMKWLRGYDYDEGTIKQMLEILNGHFPTGIDRLCLSCGIVKIRRSTWAGGQYVCLDCRHKAKGVGA